MSENERAFERNLDKSVDDLYASTPEEDLQDEFESAINDIATWDGKNVFELWRLHHDADELYEKLHDTLLPHAWLDFAVFDPKTDKPKFKNTEWLWEDLYSCIELGIRPYAIDVEANILLTVELPDGPELCVLGVEQYMRAVEQAKQTK